MTKIRCKKEFGTWFYNKIKPTWENGLDAPIYELFNSNQNFVGDFGGYGDMKYYIETGIVLA